MRLKSIEIIGFKSFAEPILLEFGPGMTVIVGPNGCGKSNISDAVRWVLGEQSAKLLRGSKMEDCIFNGTDNRKPLGMAEVSLTLAECENVLPIEYHEVTVTRRVLRSGEGQYFINKTPCRLKDIQRLFMDTGIGTNSYSLMEQGRIDLILSSRPEDRREIFEEASGITKYKTDKREALRKLEQTEANLLRLADIIKEVKRQIISLQRQAGKAARVKKLKEELRGLDIYVSSGRLQAISGELQQQENQMASLNETIEALQKDITDLEQQGAELRQALASAEAAMDGARQAEMELNSQLQQLRQTIEMNQRRIGELQSMTQRDAADQDFARQDIIKQRQHLEQTKQALDKAENELAACEAHLREKTQCNTAHEQQISQVKHSINGLHTESMELGDKWAKFQNELNKLEIENRTLGRERELRAAEQTNLTYAIEGLEKRLSGLTAGIQNMSADVQQAEALMAARRQEQSAIIQTLKELEERYSAYTNRRASYNAQIEMLTTQLADRDAWPAGTRQILDPANPLGIDRQQLLGSLSGQLETKAEFRLALEAALRHWAAAVVVADWPSALELARQLEKSDDGAAQLLVAQLSDRAEQVKPPPGPGIALIDHVSCSAALRLLLERLLAHVRVIDSFEQLPVPLPLHSIWVTRTGMMVSGLGALECGSGASQRRCDTPLARKHALQELQEASTRLQADMQDLAHQRIEQTSRLNAAEQALQQAQQDLDAQRQALARQEGECQIVTKETDQQRERLETVRWESQELDKQGEALEARSAVSAELDQIRTRRIEIKAAVATQTSQLQELEQAHKGLLAEVIQANVRLEKQKQSRDHFQSRHAPLAERIAEQDQRIAEYAQRVAEYQAEIESLTKAMDAARQAIPTLDAEIKSTATRLADIRQRRRDAEAAWQAAEDKQKTKRTTLEERRNQRQEINGHCIELRMKHQNLSERLTSEYRIPFDAIAREPEPEWPEEGQPDAEALDNTIAEMRAKIEGLGPVYEGAIEEYEQLQERFSFLSQQQDDLVKSKHQLMEMIKKINQTTTDLFASTFEAINLNFQTTFKQLFAGGSAKLMLADDEDILESGIEIIARPPGKRLQSVSLLSGGERTLTAVALLFAIYMIKPSPFCVLDELDAALDEPNNRRFIKMLEGFLGQSQFITITHNQQTIAAASVIYGVTMEETGVSKIVSMKFHQDAVRPLLQTPASEPEAVATTPSPAPAG